MTIHPNALDAIAGLSPAGAVSQKSENKGALGRDEFLKLLITQLRHQDPLKPMESVEFTAQLAQFSSLEQLFKIGDSMDGVKNSLLLQQGDQLVHYIGKSVKTAGDVVAVREGEPGPASFRIEGDGEVWVDIYDTRGTLVRKLALGFQNGGLHRAPWDGKDGAGNTAPDGDYLFEVTATDVNGSPISSQTYMSGEVTGVKYENGKAFLVVGERQVMPDSILEVNQL